MVGFRRPEKMRADPREIGKCPDFSNGLGLTRQFYRADRNPGWKPRLFNRLT